MLIKNNKRKIDLFKKRAKNKTNNKLCKQNIKGNNYKQQEEEEEKNKIWPIKNNNNKKIRRKEK